MRGIFFKIVVNTVSVFIVAWMLSGIHLENAFTAIMVAIVLALFNTFLRPLLIALTLQITAVTMGLFLLVINAGMVMLAGAVTPGFEVASFWTAFWFGILMPIISFLLGLPEKIRQQQIIIKRTMMNFDDNPMFKDMQQQQQSENSQDFQDAEIVDDDSENNKLH
ncbi:MAG: phage holin family protein [Bacteroidales bacterium]|nr:phage holin family protein [Bacteroidales bacterium]